MRLRCPRSCPVGVGALSGWRFRINAAGWATVVPESGAQVYGRLWELPVEDELALDVYEDLPGGLYSKDAVVLNASPVPGRPVMIYQATDSSPGRAAPWYLDPILEEAADCGFPEAYLEELRRWRHPLR
ncbi:MAG: gamma-glutamylcyclotransferase [Verrucomicrobiae bacterium]|nr:gamma-glutamylcyclotransferase [Verrucomicrobiae bacterium]